MLAMYAVLDPGLVQRRVEIGIRLAIGAQAGDIARRVTVAGMGDSSARSAALLRLFDTVTLRAPGT